jgi:hypothetical protein
MNEKRERVYVVRCNCCGAKIRERKEQHRSNVCLKCFYRTLSNYLGTQKRSPYGDFVSDR